MSKIIGLIGFKQVGKSTAAKYLEEKYGFVRHNMKDALVAEIKQNFPDLLTEILENEVVSILENGSYKEWEEVEAGGIERLFQTKPPLIRALLQNYGTEVRRRDDDNYWVVQWSRKIMDATLVSGYNDKFVTDDIRFLNEAKAVKDLDGILIRLTRPDIQTGGTHASETEQLEIVADYTIECKPGDHEHLYSELDRIVDMLE